MLREAEVAIAAGSTVAEASRSIGVTEQTFYRWRSEYGGLRIDQARRLKQLESENGRLRRAVADHTLDNQILKEAARGTSESCSSPPVRRAGDAHLGVSERRACRVPGHARSTERYAPRPAEDEQALTDAIVELASRFGRYGYRRITALLRMKGWDVNHKRGGPAMATGGAQGADEAAEARALWLNDGSCVRLRPTWTDHVWAYDFMQLRTQDGKRGAAVDGHGFMQP